MTPCRVLIEGYCEHSGAEWPRRGYCDMAADYRGLFGFSNKDMFAAMARFDMNVVESITLVDP